mgnify:CR=1 FL=1
MAIFTGAGVAIVTPFHHADESINYDKLDQLIDFHCNNGTDSIIVCGTTGESATMTEEEHAVYKRGRNFIGRVIRKFLYKPAKYFKYTYLNDGKYLKQINENNEFLRIISINQNQFLNNPI